MSCFWLSYVLVVLDVLLVGFGTRPLLLAWPVFIFFRIFFPDHFFYNMWCPNVSKWSTKTAQNHKHLQKLINKTLPQSRHAQRLRLEWVKPPKSIIVLHFQQFFQRPRAPKKESKWTENGTTGHLKSQKSRQNTTHKNNKKTTAQKYVNVIKNNSKRD